MLAPHRPLRSAPSCSRSLAFCLATDPGADAIYIDESASSTSTSTGSLTAPFPSPLAALLARGPDASPLLVKKAKGTEPDAPEPTFEPISGAALKKAKKLYEAEKKKMDKAEANKDKLAKEAEESKVRDAKKREEASKIILVEDASLPKAVVVRPKSARPPVGSVRPGSHPCRHLSRPSL